MLKDFLKEHKVTTLYRYYTEGVSEVHFGWIVVDSIDLSQKIVVSYPSKSKNATEEEKAAALSAGRSAATLDDYQQYFVALTGQDWAVFLEKYPTSDELLSNTNYSETQGTFLYKLANFLLKEKKINVSGRGYKMVEFDNEIGNKESEIQQEEA